MTEHLDTLRGWINEDGGLGYAPGLQSQLEPTCFGWLALSADPERYANELTRLRAFIVGCLQSNGSYRTHRSRESAIWPTSLVLFARALLDFGADLASSVQFLLGVKGQVADLQYESELHDIDLRLTGWPWAEGNFSWVEPTSWACLALRRLGLGQHPRVAEGQKLLLDRALEAGGINYGNRVVLGKTLDPIPTPSALLLIALQGEQHPRLDSSVRYLLSQINSNDIEHLAWGKLALDLYRELPEVPAELTRLDGLLRHAHEQRQQIPWLKPSVMRQSLLALALNVERRNVFRLPPTHTAAPAAHETADFKPRIASPSITQKLGSWFRGVTVKALGQLRPLPATSAVHIAKAESYDLELSATLRQQYEHFRSIVPLQDKRVVLKPNLVEFHRNKVINTDPRVVSAVIEMCKREGAKEIIVAEGPGHWRNVEFLVRESGLGEVLDRHQTPFVDINHDDPVKTPNFGQLTGLEYLYLSRTIVEADVVISLPKLKTHHWAGATLSLKNLFGTLPGICYGWPKNELHWRGIHQSIIDIALTRTPHLAIVDGIVGMEGDGPLNGTAKPFGALIMGHDLVAVDATCCRLMQLDPEKIPYLQMGAHKRLGRLPAHEIPQLGETIESLSQPFATVPHLEEIQLRKSA